jgi:hypothetical protein
MTSRNNYVWTFSFFFREAQFGESIVQMLRFGWKMNYKVGNGSRNPPWITTEDVKISRNILIIIKKVLSNIVNSESALWRHRLRLAGCWCCPHSLAKIIQELWPYAETKCRATKGHSTPSSTPTRITLQALCLSHLFLTHTSNSMLPPPIFFFSYC